MTLEKLLLQRGATVAEYLEALGYSVAWTLTLAYRLVRRPLDYVLSSRLQRLLFVALARGHTWLVVGVPVACALTASFILQPRPLVTAGILLLLIPLNGLFYRLKQHKSVLLSSVYGRKFRVHLPATALSPGDALSFREQIVDVLRIARAGMARSVQMESPLLVADSTHRLVVRQLVRAAKELQLEVSVVSDAPRETSRLEQAMLAGHLRRYATELRGARMPSGAAGRRMTRCVTVHLPRA
ncbi:hypothetical protein [Burkholderia ambifaria]|uniref:hypothetical protein n=1 Tax=Burkholderia ambifaria TaxID=152480 RepID=UPI000F7FC623|nr:hypothetical protein [Burkholderia ambifaria]